MADRQQHNTAALVLQCDGSYIAAAQCTCPPPYMTDGQVFSLDCPIDQHRIKWLAQHWEFDDDGRVTTGDSGQDNGEEHKAESFRLVTTAPGCIQIVTEE